jgi:hypothetical protein
MLIKAARGVLRGAVLAARVERDNEEAAANAGVLPAETQASLEYTRRLLLDPRTFALGVARK